MKKIFVLVLVVMGGFWLLKKSNLMSYAGVLWSTVKQETKSHMPTPLELERARLEIANLDRDISRMLRPIAEHMAAINRLKKDIANTRTQLAEQKESMLAVTRDLESKPATLTYGGEVFTADRVRTMLQRDFESFKRWETNLKSQEKLLEAKERSLAATREQLAKMIAKKREYEIRLAQLDADEETLKIARMGTKIKLDDSRASEIESILSHIEHRHDVQRAELDLLNGPHAQDFLPAEVRTKTRSNVDVTEIRNYLQGQAAATVSQK